MTPRELPLELAEEFNSHVANPGDEEEIWYWSPDGDYPEPKDVRAFLSKVYSTAYKAGLEEAKGLLKGVKIHLDASICECGEKYSESDASIDCDEAIEVLDKRIKDI